MTNRDGQDPGPQSGNHETPGEREGDDAAAIAERYLDFWQRNLMEWACEPDLFHEWARKVINQNDGTKKS